MSGLGPQPPSARLKLLQDQFIMQQNQFYRARDEANGGQPWPPEHDHPLRILCLDGGGYRGISALIVVGAFLKAKYGDDEDHKISDTFDLVVGTSTGGLAALLLGRLDMTVGQAIKAYEELGPKIFTNDGNIARWALTGHARFDTAEMEAYIVEKLSGSSTVRSTEPHCKTAVTTTYAKGTGRCLLIRSYPPKAGWDGLGTTMEDREITIVQAARATSAAPT